jgi:hypothetical protein
MGAGGSPGFVPVLHPSTRPQSGRSAAPMTCFGSCVGGHVVADAGEVNRHRRITRSRSHDLTDRNLDDLHHGSTTTFVSLLTPRYRVKLGVGQLRNRRLISHSKTPLSAPPREACFRALARRRSTLTALRVEGGADVRPQRQILYSLPSQWRTRTSILRGAAQSASQKRPHRAQTGLGQRNPVKRRRDKVGGFRQIRVSGPATPKEMLSFRDSTPPLQLLGNSACLFCTVKVHVQANKHMGVKVLSMRIQSNNRGLRSSVTPDRRGLD